MNNEKNNKKKTHAKTYLVKVSKCCNRTFNFSSVIEEAFRNSGNFTKKQK